MHSILLGTLHLVWLVTSSPVDSNRYLIDSRPILFVDEPDAEAQIVNSTLVLKKKNNTVGPVYYEERKPDSVINNHYVPPGEGVVWRRPQISTAQSFSNHKGNYQSLQKWSIKRPTTTTLVPVNIGQEEIIINNHNSNRPIKTRPHRPTSIVSITDNSPTIQAATDVLGDRVKGPDTIKSATINVLDAPTNVRTTIKHNKIIVVQKRTDMLIPSQVEQENEIFTTVKPTKIPEMANFSVAPVMDPWSNIPIPTRPSWVTPVKGGNLPVKGGNSPVKGGNSQAIAPQTIIPNLPFMPFISSLISPLLSKPLSPSAVNSGMQGIKAMQGFLRNSLMGAMFCFLPSAFIALSLTATQRAELRKIPEVDDMMVFCKKCLENLKNMKPEDLEFDSQETS